MAPEGDSPAPAPAAPPPDVLRVWLRFVRLNRRLYAAMTTELKAVQLSVSQFDLLSTLTEAEGMSQQELADRLYVTKGNVSGLVDRLVGNGLVERRPFASDRRSHALHLTDRGREAAALGMDIQRRYVDQSLGQLNPVDVAALDRALIGWRDILRATDSLAAERKPKSR